MNQQQKALEDHLRAVEAKEDSMLIEGLKQLFPRGHEDFVPLAVAELKLHSMKSYDYAKGGHVLGNFNRVAAILALYPGLDTSDRRVVALVYALKQLDAVLWGLAKKIVHKVEGLNARLGDISVYAKLVMCMNLEDSRNKGIDEQFGVDLAQTAGACAKPLTTEGQDQHKRPETSGQIGRVEVSAQGRRELDTKCGCPCHHTRPATGDCPELNRTRDAEEANPVPRTRRY